MTALVGPDTVNPMMRGRFHIIQSRNGHRAGLDAMLLAATVPPDAAGHLVDLGAGCGTVAFAALTRAPRLTATLIERDPDECARARAALELSDNRHLLKRVTICEGFVEVAPGMLGDRVADYVLANPPFNDDSLPRSPDPARARAHGGSVGTLTAWHRVTLRLLRPNARAAFIHRAAWWPRASLGRGFGDERLVPILPRAGAEATRIIVTARTARRTVPSIAAPVVLHGEDGTFTPHLAAILEGRAGLFDAGGRPL